MSWNRNVGDILGRIGERVGEQVGNGISGSRAASRAAWDVQHPSSGPCDACGLQNSSACGACPFGTDGRIDVAAPELDGLYRAVRARLGTVAAFDTCALVAVDGLTALNADGLHTDAADAALAVRARSTGRIETSTTLTDAERHLLGAVAAAAYVPVVSDGAVLGLVALGWNDPNRARRVDLGKVATFASTFIGAASTILLSHRARAAEANAIAMVDAVGALSSQLTVQEVANVAVLHARKLAKAHTARLIVLGRDETLSVLAANPATRHPSQRRLNGSSALLQAIDDQETTLETSPTRTYVYLPVRAEGAARGVLQLTFTGASKRPSKRVLQLCEAIAAQTGVALERAERADELARQAITDVLTGLGNRRQILQDLSREISRAARKGDPLTIALLDLDHFKQYNDQHGHVAGDRHLAAFGQFLDAKMRAMDVAGRYGGEEFLIVLASTSTTSAFTCVDRLRREWAKVSGGSTFSAGIAQLRPGDEGVDLVNRADMALYQAKADGRNRVETAEGDLVSLSAIEGGAGADVEVVDAIEIDEPITTA